MTLSRCKAAPAAPATAAGRRRLAAVALTLAAALGLSACAVRTVEWQNRQPAQELARQQAAPPGSVAAGWRVYQQRCAACHGTDATGGDGAPDLTFRLRDIGPQRFVDLVLRRYDWMRPEGGAGAPRETLIDDIVERRLGDLRMPAWQGEPVVTAHVMDLYAYLSARAQGALGPGQRPR